MLMVVWYLHDKAPLQTLFLYPWYKYVSRAPAGIIAEIPQDNSTGEYSLGKPHDQIRSPEPWFLWHSAAKPHVDIDPPVTIHDYLYPTFYVHLLLFKFIQVTSSPFVAQDRRQYYPKPKFAYVLTLQSTRHDPMSHFAYPSPPSSVRTDSRTFKSRTGTPQNSSPTSIITRGSSGTIGSMGSPGFLSSKPPSPKYSLFPPPDYPSEVVEASIPTLIAARAPVNAKSVPNFKMLSETFTHPDTANVNCPMPRAVSNPESGIKKAMNKLSQKAEYTKRDRGLSFKETLKRLLSKKSSASLRNKSSESGKQSVEIVTGGNSLGSTSSSPIEDGKSTSGAANTPGLPEEDEVPELANISTLQKVIRRIRSEADFSPKVSKINFASRGDIGPPPVKLPPTPEISPCHERQVSSNVFNPFPARQDSLQYASANIDPGSGSQVTTQLSNGQGLTTLSCISINSCEELPLLDSGIAIRQGNDGSSSNSDLFYLEARLTALENDRAEVYSPFDDQFGVYPEANQIQYTYPESITEIQLSDPFYSPGGFSDNVGLSEPETVNNCCQRGSRLHDKGNMSSGQSRTSQTGSPSPRSPEPENVPRGILDTFIENLMRNGHGNAGDRRGGLLAPIRHNEEDGSENQLSKIRKTLAWAIEDGEVLDFPTTMALADFVMRSLDVFTYDRLQKTEKVKRQRQLLKAQKERLDSAIASAMDAEAMLKEEEMGLEMDQEEVMRRSLQLTEIMDGECYSP
ncbi:hypothetical protein EV426DRAFT_575868 [Tirmania nivea]|nr:hypothetical protein EV426DRAFT_575868 [Tirmania nivea]